MIDIIRELIRLLSQDPLSVEDVISRVGPVVDDPGAPMPIDLQPVLSGVRAANLDRYPDNGLPYALTIELEPGARVTAAALQQAFGDYMRLHTDRGHPPEIIFYPQAVGSQWTVAVIAKLESAAVSLDNQPVTSVSLRRDPVAP
jgi:hypothetical protein